MDGVALPRVVQEHLTMARAATSGRSAQTICGGHQHALRQTVLALAAGRGLDEHANPGEATLQVLAGRVRLVAAEQCWEGSAGDHVVIPQARHSLDAIEDSAILLTVVNRPIT